MKKIWKIRLQWKLQDLWVGVYWDNDYLGQHIWICLVPCVPIHIWSSYVFTGTKIPRVKEGETTTTTQKGDKQESDIIR